MPFTSYHIGPALLFGMVFFRYISFPTFVVASAIIDIEPLLVLLFSLDLPLHGFFHSFIGGSIIAVLLSVSMIRFDEQIREIMSVFKLEQKPSKKRIWASSFFGIYLHIFLDSFLYADIRPFYPIVANPLYSSSLFGVSEINALCILSFILGIGIYTYKILKD